MGRLSVTERPSLLLTKGLQNLGASDKSGWIVVMIVMMIVMMIVLSFLLLTFGFKNVVSWKIFWAGRLSLTGRLSLLLTKGFQNGVT